METIIKNGKRMEGIQDEDEQAEQIAYYSDLFRLQGGD